MNPNDLSLDELPSAADWRSAACDMALYPMLLGLKQDPGAGQDTLTRIIEIVRHYRPINRSIVVKKLVQTSRCRIEASCFRSCPI
jgi:hypothetical protein